jgi:hypothetical protein
MSWVDAQSGRIEASWPKRALDTAFGTTVTLGGYRRHDARQA